MTRERWRYIDSGALAGAMNMAVDEALLEGHLRGGSSPTLRVYGWRPAAISLGRFQEVEASVELASCRQLGIDVVRRPTGGRAILHTDEEVTFSVVVSEARLGSRGIMESYRALAGAIAAGLRWLGLKARLVERGGKAVAGGEIDPACFAVKARCDLVVGESKLVGSAQVHREGIVLQQNSLPLRLHAEEWAKVFRRRSNTPEAQGLWEAAGREIGFGEVASALRRGFEEAFEVEFEEGELTAWEKARAEELALHALVQD